MEVDATVDVGKQFRADLSKEKKLVRKIIENEGFLVPYGDFNTVRSADERKGSRFKQHVARDFNFFIEEADLHEFNMKGNKFTYLKEDENGVKLSKIDRCLVNRGVIDMWPDATFQALPRRLSDHNPIMLTIKELNFGPKPFRFFNSWLDRPECETTVNEALDSYAFNGPPDTKLMRKFKWIRQALKKWRDELTSREGEEYEMCKKELEELDLQMEIADLNDEDSWVRTECKRKLSELEENKKKDLRQRSRGTINRGCGSAFITLIPKVRDPSQLNDYRPITLIGVTSKVISKVLANRIRFVLGSLICCNQTAFLEDRLISDGPLILNEVISWIRKNKKKAFIFKVDFNKAYDNVNWCFLIDILSQLGFPRKWCDWIYVVLASARSAVLVNGSPTFEFQCFKGMRQGDPISPFLFIVVMEALSTMLRKASCNWSLKGISLPNNGPVISHLLYADDCAFLGEWSVENLNMVARILRVFHICSGLKINLGKSLMFGIGVSESEVKWAADVVKCKPGIIPFIHLGIRISSNMNRVANWDFLFDIFKKRLSSWKASCLSIAGRVTLIKSVLENLPTYYLSLFKAPLKVIEAKLFWRYRKEPDGLWRRTIKAIHESKRCWAAIPFNKNVTGVWYNIVRSISKVKVADVSLGNLFRGVCGDGSQIRFWLDPWLRDAPLKEEFPVLFKKEKEKKMFS
uniref:uncharacterized protein LOC122601202 n=1 Tax=Erigeron canadensis TaxID=72917 RepID=UPI001CB8AFE8|nr:uncharacterized protein LOC122601202 [Erigeron canadensis]